MTNQAQPEVSKSPKSNPIEINEERHHMNLGGLAGTDITVNLSGSGSGVILLAIDEEIVALRPGAAAALGRWLLELADQAVLR
jgi:Fe2+ transport system protein FeoA